MTPPQSPLSKLGWCLFLLHVRPANKQNLTALPHLRNGSTIKFSLGGCHFPFLELFWAGPEAGLGYPCGCLPAQDIL